ncbi:MAG: sigma-70 family RNA polymerase sigma factor [Dehalococcoidia bacterium]|nr:RNA polymerase sigma factor YlaC [Chloroflexota bacterium]MBT9160171.1 RNA polymerase sigma factor YlaC [Chloroflexota bacterium]MBT9162173.1 RNA polymerase sigma factor YlaC [Chloroflexota bacterium]
MSQDSTTETRSAKDALASLYEEYYDRIVRYIFVRIDDQNEAENLGGDVFLRALQSLDSYRGQREQMRAWLFKIAHNLVVDYLRKMSKRKDISINEIQIPDDKPTVEEVVETKLQIEELSKALKRLTPAQREVIGLRFFAELSSAETGKILGRSNGAVREMQRAAIETLRTQMGVQAK